MIGYRFLSAAEDEMSETAVFYETRCLGLGSDFLDDIQHTIDTLRTQPEIGIQVGGGLRTRWNQTEYLSSQSHIIDAVLAIGVLAQTDSSFRGPTDAERVAR